MRPVPGRVSRAIIGGDGADLATRGFRTKKLAQVRLRIPIVLVVAALVVGRWELIRNYWDRMTRGTFSESIALQAVSADTEYFCPMDPGVVSDWPGRCGICNMALVRRQTRRGRRVARRRGGAHMQLSPYRIQLAGIRTAPATFQPLRREVESSGVVARNADSASVFVEIPARQAPWIAQGQTAAIVCADLAGHGVLAGRVHAAERRSIDGWEYTPPPQSP